MPRRNSAATAGSTVRAHGSEMGSWLSSSIGLGSAEPRGMLSRKPARRSGPAKTGSPREEGMGPSGSLRSRLPKCGLLVDDPLPGLCQQELGPWKVVFAEGVGLLETFAVLVGSLNACVEEGHLAVANSGLVSENRYGEATVMKNIHGLGGGIGLGLVQGGLGRGGHVKR